MFSSRKIALLFIGVIMVAYGLLYAGALSILHDNGFSPRDMIVGVEGGDGDSYQYVALATTMLTDGRFAMSATAEPESFRTPGYPIFLVAVLAVFKNIAFLPLVQIVLAALSCGLIFLMGERLFSRGIGLGAALLFAIEPAVPSSTFVSMSDTLFVFVFLCALYVLTLWRHTPRNLFLGGALMGVITLIRPLGLYVIPLVLLWIVWESRAERPVLYRTTLAFLIGAVLVVAPWMVRNAVIFNHFSLSSIGSYNLYFYEREFEHQYTGKPKAELTAEMYQTLGATTTDRVESFRFADQNSQLAWQGILAHPFAYTAFHLYSMVPFYFGSSIDTSERTIYSRGLHTGQLPPDINISALISSGDLRGATRALLSNIPVFTERLLWLVLCLLALGFTAVAAYKRKANAALCVLFLALILAFGFMTGPVAYSRYRLPIEPLIFLLGCAGATAIVRTLLSRHDV